MRTCLRTVLGTVALAAGATALCSFSAWADGDPLPAVGVPEKNGPLPPTEEPLPTIGGPAKNDPLPETGDPLPMVGVPEKNGPLPPTEDPLPAIGGPSINNTLPNPIPSTGDYRFADGENPIIVLKPVGEPLPDSGKNDFLTVPGKDDPIVESPKLLVEPLSEKGWDGAEGNILGEKQERNEQDLLTEKRQIDESVGGIKESNGDKKEGENIFVAIARTLEANAEKEGSYQFGCKILADGGSTITGAGIELSQSLNFRNSFKIPFEFEKGKSNYRMRTRKLDPGSTFYYRAYVRNAAGVNVGSVKKLKVPESAGKTGWLNEGENLGAGWRRSNWFGTYRKVPGMDWVYHQKLGWTYVAGDQREGLWLWQEENGWTWTQPGVWPCLWRNNSGSWLYLMTTFAGKPIFYDYRTGKFRNLPKKQAKAEKEKTGSKLEKPATSKTKPVKSGGEEVRKVEQPLTEPVKSGGEEVRKAEPSLTEPVKSKGEEVRKVEPSLTEPLPFGREEVKIERSLAEPLKSAGEEVRKIEPSPTVAARASNEQPKTIETDSARPSDTVRELLR